MRERLFSARQKCTRPRRDSPCGCPRESASQADRDKPCPYDKQWTVSFRVAVRRAVFLFLLHIVKKRSCAEHDTEPLFYFSVFLTKTAFSATALRALFLCVFRIRRRVRILCSLALCRCGARFTCFLGGVGAFLRRIKPLALFSVAERNGKGHAPFPTHKNYTITKS